MTITDRLAEVMAEIRAGKLSGHGRAASIAVLNALLAALVHGSHKQIAASVCAAGTRVALDAVPPPQTERVQ